MSSGSTVVNILTTWMTARYRECSEEWVDRPSTPARAPNTCIYIKDNIISPMKRKESLGFKLSEGSDPNQ